MSDGERVPAIIEEVTRRGGKYSYCPGMQGMYVSDVDEPWRGEYYIPGWVHLYVDGLRDELEAERQRREEAERCLARCPECGAELQRLSETGRIVHAALCDGVGRGPGGNK